MSESTLTPESAENQPVDATPVVETAAAPTLETPAAETPATPEVAVAAEAPAAEAPVAEAPSDGKTEEERAEEIRKKKEEAERKAEERRLREVTYAELQGKHEAKERFDVTVIERVKGGLRAEYKNVRVFLPASHFGLRKNVAEEELTHVIGMTIPVMVHEIQSDDSGYKSVVVTRRDIIADEFWKNIEPGTVHDGVVSSVTQFGAFVNIGGVEGLLHVSRMSRSRIENPADVVKRGDKIKVTIVEVDKDKQKLSLSHKEHEEDPWKGVETTFPLGRRIKGTVKRVTDFGAYVQVAPKIEGLIRIGELSWTRRIKHPSEIVTPGQEIEVEVIGASEQKHQLSLSFKATQANPWDALATSLPIGTETEGIVQQTSMQGSVIRVGDGFDGFMPRSKTLNAGRGQKVQVNVGDTIKVVVVDMNPANQSLILAMKGEDGTIGGQEERGHEGHEGRPERRERGDRDRGPSTPIPGENRASAGVSLGDLLNEKAKSALTGDQ
jgi:small subunit ribosomal protein S1